MGGRGWVSLGFMVSTEKDGLLGRVKGTVLGRKEEKELERGEVWGGLKQATKVTTIPTHNLEDEGPFCNGTTPMTRGESWGERHKWSVDLCRVSGKWVVKRPTKKKKLKEKKRGRTQSLPEPSSKSEKKGNKNAPNA